MVAARILTYDKYAPFKDISISLHSPKKKKKDISLRIKSGKVNTAASTIAVAGQNSQ